MRDLGLDCCLEERLIAVDLDGDLLLNSSGDLLVDRDTVLLS